MDQYQGLGKPLCQYGSKCYRKNPAHFEEFAHPGSESKLDEDNTPPVAKAPKLTNDDVVITINNKETSSGDKPHPCCHGEVTDPMFYLAKVRGIESQYNGPDMALGMKDILSMGDLISSVQFNYLFDLEWMVSQYPENKRNTPILVVHGDQQRTTPQLQREARPYPNIKLIPAKLDSPFGTHHSKMMLLRYKEGIRVVIHTANLIQKDWDQKSQGIWISSVFPKCEGKKPETSGSSNPDETGFKHDLLEYLERYGSSALKEWIELVEGHDTREARVRLIASVPGAHTKGNINKWGHLKLRKVLSEFGLNEEELSEKWPVIGQFSSVGSLGPNSHSWLSSEWLLSLSSCKKIVASSLHKYPNLHLIFPTVNNVKNSLEGYMAGGSIPYSKKTAFKQPYLTSYLYQWKADCTGRSRAAPHIKTYCRISNDGSKAAWFLLTSANLSKAAWGGLEKKGAQLRIRSYEIGVLFLPSLQIPPLKHFEIKKPSSSSSESVLPLPFDVPLTGYSAEDQPWIWDSKYLQPDTHGHIWSPS